MPIATTTSEIEKMRWLGAPSASPTRPGGYKRMLRPSPRHPFQSAVVLQGPQEGHMGPKFLGLQMGWLGTPNAIIVCVSKLVHLGPKNSGPILVLLCWGLWSPHNSKHFWKLQLDLRRCRRTLIVLALCGHKPSPINTNDA